MPLAPDPLDTPPPGDPNSPPRRPKPTSAGGAVESSGDHLGSRPSSISPHATPEDQAVETERRELESGEESAT